MSGALIMASSVGGGEIVAGDQNLVDFQIAPTDSNVDYQVRADGTVWELSTSGNSELENWIEPVSEAPGSWEINVTSSGDALDAGSDSTGVDLALTSNRNWGLQVTGTNSKSATLTVRYKLGGVVVKTVTVNLSCTVEP